MTQQETNIWRRALLELSPAGFRLFRNQRYKGPIVHKGEITKSFADCGLKDGAGDLIGYRIITITPEMVGKKFAQFVSGESKVPGKGVIADKQQTWADVINNDGGLAVFIRTEEDMLKIATSKPLGA